MENLIECKISKEDLKTLYEKLCVDSDTENKYCEKCVLSRITYHAGGVEISRDLCFAIWHDGFLASESENRKKRLMELVEQEIDLTDAS